VLLIQYTLNYFSLLLITQTFRSNCSTANLLFNFSNIRHPHAVPLFLALTEPQSISMEKSCESSEEEL
jgi:hypothetical protein